MRGFDAFAIRPDKDIQDEMKSFGHSSVRYPGAAGNPLPDFDAGSSLPVRNGTGRPAQHCFPLLIYYWSYTMTSNDAGKPRQRSFMATMVAIAWSFVGLRSKKDFDEDREGGMNPVYVILAGLIGTGIFIGVLMFFVKQAVA